MISRLASSISFTDGKNNTATGKTRERQAPITKTSDSDDKEEVTPPPRNSSRYHTIDTFHSSNNVAKPKHVELEHRHQFENPDERVNWEPIGPIG